MKNEEKMKEKEEDGNRKENKRKIREKKRKEKEKRWPMIPRLAFFLLGLLAQETSCSKSILNQAGWIRIPKLLIASCVIFSNLLNLFET